MNTRWLLRYVCASLMFLVVLPAFSETRRLRYDSYYDRYYYEYDEADSGRETTKTRDTKVTEEKETSADVTAADKDEEPTPAPKKKLKSALGKWLPYAEAQALHAKAKEEKKDVPWLIYITKTHGRCLACRDIEAGFDDADVTRKMEGYLLSKVAESDVGQYRVLMEFMREQGWIDWGEEGAPILILMDGANSRYILGGIPANSILRFFRDEVVARPPGCAPRAPRSGDPGLKYLRPNYVAPKSEEKYVAKEKPKESFSGRTSDSGRSSGYSGSTTYGGSSDYSRSSGYGRKSDPDPAPVPPPVKDTAKDSFLDRHSERDKDVTKGSSGDRSSRSESSSGTGSSSYGESSSDARKSAGTGSSSDGSRYSEERPKEKPKATLKPRVRFYDPNSRRYFYRDTYRGSDGNFYYTGDYYFE